MSEEPLPPLLTLFHGPPGSGKTTLARRLEEEGHGLRIATDEWQSEIGVDPRDGVRHERLQSLLYQLALDLLDRGVDVILEDGLWMRAERERVFADARRRGARIHWHIFQVPADELRRRLASREADPGLGEVPVTSEQLTAILALLEAPRAQEYAAVDEVTVHR